MITHYFDLALSRFCLYNIPMSSCSPIFPQHYLPLPKAKKTHKVVDIHSFVGIITQQLSNSATQQLSNSATQA